MLNQPVKRWLTTKQAADYLSTSPKGILNQVHRGKLKAYKYGSHNRYRLEDLDALIEGYCGGLSGDSNDNHVFE